MPFVPPAFITSATRAPVSARRRRIAIVGFLWRPSAVEHGGHVCAAEMTPSGSMSGGLRGHLSAGTFCCCHLDLIASAAGRPHSATVAVGSGAGVPLIGGPRYTGDTAFRRRVSSPRPSPAVSPAWAWNTQQTRVIPGSLSTCCCRAPSRGSRQAAPEHAVAPLHQHAAVLGGSSSDETRGRDTVATAECGERSHCWRELNKRSLATCSPPRHKAHV